MEVQELKSVPLEQWHIDANAKMVGFAGYNMPVRYTSDLEEHHTVRNAVGIFDVSHMGEFEVKGSGAIELLQYITSNDVATLVPGKAQYSCLPNGAGGIVDDIIVYMIAENHYLVVVNASNIDKDWNWFVKHNTFNAELKNLSDEYSLFAVQGPKAIQTLQKLTNFDLSSIPYYHFNTIVFNGIENVFVSNTGYTGAGGFEVMVKNEDALKVWNAIMEAGTDLGIKPIGLGARDTLRLEMGFCLYGNDINDTTSPIEAGLGWITKFNKDFIDKTLLQNQKENGVKRKLVGFELIDKGIARGHYPIVDENKNVIGEVTSGTQSPTLTKAIGLGYVAVESAKIDSEIFIDVRGRALKAKVVKLPFVKK